MQFLSTIISILLVVGARAREPGDTGYTDTCDYRHNEDSHSRKAMCGDKCITWSSFCYCGSDPAHPAFRPFYSDYKCCLEPGASIGEGRRLHVSAPCNTTVGVKCYNSYQDSKYLGHKHHYTCPNTCVPWQKMCQGVRWCEGDLDVCGPDLRCMTEFITPGHTYGSGTVKHIYNVEKLNITSSLVTGHHYCIGDDKINDGKLDTIDRFDETEVKASKSLLDLEISSFTPCNITTLAGAPGTMCGKDCRLSSLWCNDDITNDCNTETGIISTNDPLLCRDPRVWDDASCSVYLTAGGVVDGFGYRCTGQNKRCVMPWFLVFDGEPYKPVRRLSQFILPTQCPDKSDQVFNSSMTCGQHLQQYVEFHTKHFCNNEKYQRIQTELIKLLSSELICTNKTQWLLGRDPSYSDPRSCQASCSLPGPDCQACSNSSYFPCPKSGQCVHPDLVCDGNTQCIHGEDEDLDRCYDKYIEMKIIVKLATFKCKSILNEKMFVYATPRDKKVECYDGSDEPEQDDGSLKFLVSSAVLIMLLYIGLKYFCVTKKLLSDQNTPVNVESYQNLPLGFLQYKSLKKFGENHDQNETIAETNIHLLNSIHTQTVDVNKEICVQFYDLEHQVHANNEAEIHWCLHKKMDPSVVENILDSGEPGCTTGCIEGFENLLGRRLITRLKNNPRL